MIIDLIPYYMLISGFLIGLLVMAYYYNNIHPLGALLKAHRNSESSFEMEQRILKNIEEKKQREENI